MKHDDYKVSMIQKLLDIDVDNLDIFKGLIQLVGFDVLDGVDDLQS